jgi:hypothetical protein
VDKRLWRQVGRLVARQHAAVGNDSEVTWALWLLKELRFKIPRDVADVVVSNCGPLPNALLAHCLKRKLVNDAKLKQKLWEKVEGDLCAGPFWPLTLELHHLDMGSPSWAPLIAATASPLRILHDAKASLIDWNALPKVFEDDVGDDPDYAIEDYSFDYGDDYAPGYWDGDDIDLDGPSSPAIQDLSRLLGDVVEPMRSARGDSANLAPVAEDGGASADLPESDG